MKIFVSYRSTDRHYVNQLVSDLEDMDYELWYDQELEGGQNWWEKILENIRWCDTLVFALSFRSIESIACQREYTYANELKRHILPVQLVKGIDVPMLPILLQERQIIDYSERSADAVLKLSKALHKLPAAPSLPKPLPKPPDAPISPLAKIKEQIDQSKLTQDEQAAIVIQLKAYLNQDEYSSGVRQLLERLSGHPDLYATVYRDIEAVLDAPQLPAPLSAINVQIQQPTLTSDEQSAILKQLAGYLNNPEYDEGARQLLVELKGHSSLLVDVYKEIDSVLAMPPSQIEKAEPPSPVPEDVDELPIPVRTTAPSQPPQPTEFLEGEALIGELDVTLVPGGRILGGILAAARHTLKRRLQLTNQRILFLAPIINDKVYIIPYDEIHNIRKVDSWLTSGIDLTTKSGEVHKFSIVTSYGTGFGNPEDLVEFIKEQMAKL